MNSLRRKIVLGFAAVGAFVVGLSLLAVYELWRMERGMVAEEAIAALVEAVADMRRYEKNYFLYRDPSDIDHNRAYADAVARLLADNAEQLADLREPDLPGQTEMRLATYRAAIDRFAADPSYVNEAAVRAEGKGISAIAEWLAENRRDALHSAMRSNTIWVLGVIVGSLVMLAGVGSMLLFSVTRPLAAVQHRMEEFADGRLERIDLPGGDAEIRSLVAAINRVLDELELRRQQMLVSEKLASLGVMLSGVAHELNNPLSNISTSAQILLEEGGADPEFTREHLVQIDEQTERAQRIVASLLDFSRNHRFLKEAVVLRPLIEETVTFVRGSVPASATIDVEVPENLTVPADRQRLQQVMLNLLKNAGESLDGGGRVAVRARADLDDVLIEVADDGCGIAAEDLAHVFDPFYTTKEIDKGSGLGLFIVHDIVKKHGGRITVASAPGQGTTFLVRLPLSAAPAGA